MKRLYYIISFLVILFLFNSCYDDDSSLAVKEIAEIQVTSNVKDTINLYLGDNISIKNQYSYTEMTSVGNGVSVNTRKMR